MLPLPLHGCAPVPLAHYLKALGILRVVSEQRDADAKAAWRNDHVTLLTNLSSDALVGFFLWDYSPSPVLAPWNGGSGFFPKDNKEALEAIKRSDVVRLSAYRAGIAAAHKALASLAIDEKPDGDTKALLLQSCRNAFPDDSLAWLDAVLVLGRDGAKFPPLLGTGGNDGRLEFTNNFMQRITEVMKPETGEPTAESERWLRAALFAEAAPGLATKAPIGQFFPGAAGGANSTSGFDAPSSVNPWDFILMIEGALLFAAASVKRLESGDDGALVYPFCVRQVSVAYASAAGSDEAEARCEMWMPLWTEPTALAELKAIFSEGRAQVRGRTARNGVDFVQAAVTLGVDRGIDAFQRYGFQVRNGLAYFATPLERIVVRRNARASLLSDIEQWHDRLRQKAGPRAEPPTSVGRALNRLENRVFALCREDSAANLQSLLAALGSCERALARSFKWTTENYLRPLHGLNVHWLEASDDGSPEHRLAQSLASTRAWLGHKTLWFREHLEPLSIGINNDRTWANWADQPTNDVVWNNGDLIEMLNAILSRRLIRVEQSGAQGWPDWSPRPASLADITAFIEGRINEPLLADLIWGLSAVDWQRVSDTAHIAEVDDYIPSSCYALLRLCFRRATKGSEHDVIPIVPTILQRAIAGDGTAASEFAARRLRACGQAPLVRTLPVSGDIARRTAAAMLFPIAPCAFRLLEQMTLKQVNQQSV
jgi:CRISPR-associated protein Csx17